MSFGAECEIMLNILDASNNIREKYYSKSSATVYCAFYWGYSLTSDDRVKAANFKAVKNALEGVNGKMVTLVREEGPKYKCTTGLAELKDVANGEKKVLTLDGVEFIRRFLWHVLPKGYVRIRHFGLHNSYARAERLPQARALLGLEPALPEAEPLSLRVRLIEAVGVEEIDRCPHCGREATLFKRGEFEGINWLHLCLMGLIKLGIASRVRRW